MSHTRYNSVGNREVARTHALPERRVIEIAEMEDMLMVIEELGLNYAALTERYREIKQREAPLFDAYGSQSGCFGEFRPEDTPEEDVTSSKPLLKKENYPQRFYLKCQLQQLYYQEVFDAREFLLDNPELTPENIERFAWKHAHSNECAQIILKYTQAEMQNPNHCFDQPVAKDHVTAAEQAALREQRNKRKQTQ